MSGLREAEVVTLADWESDTFGDTLDEAPFDALVTVVERILAARVASVAAERDQAVAVADSMQHFADVAEVCERKSNEYAAENAALRARLDEVRALHAPDSSGDWCDHCWTGPDAHGNGPGPAWPCATIRALDPVLAAARDEGSEQR